MALQKVAGEKLYIGGVLPDKAADYVAADFTSQTWVMVDGYSSRPPLGDQSTEIATDLINRGRTVVQKGTRRSPAGEHRFAAIASDAGQIALKAAADSNANFAFKVVKDDGAPRSATVTITSAAEGVVSWTAHGLAVGNKVVLTTDGALPGPNLSNNGTYFVQAVVDANSFKLASTSGGAALSTTGNPTQGGTHRATTVATGSESLFIGLVLSKTDQGGEANTASMITFNIAPNSNIVEVAAKAVS